MTNERSRQAHAIFLRAIDLEAPGRDEFVRDSCAGDPVLESRVRRLLAALDHSTGFLDVPALGTPISPGAAESIPGEADRHTVDPAAIRVPGYRPVRVLGVGGMAAVYEAQQYQPERTVALKVMSRGLNSASAARRFKYETEVLARLHHPGIAQIFEAGTCDDGTGGGGSGGAMPFFAMEFIPEARTITDHANECGLSLRDRLELFAGVCDAVQHGHQLGVIHRDLKPGNVLVDGEGNAKVIDFGIARRVNPGVDPGVDPSGAGITEAAGVAQLIGTLNSMSPEQCRDSSSVDARTDVYSLGVMLFELVVGRLPHDLSGKLLPEAVRTIVECDAPRARVIRPEVPRDLDAIIAKALSRDRAHRYGGVDSLASDIRRFLTGMPVEARHAGSLELLGKLAKRNRPLSVAVALLAVTMIAGIAVSGRYAIIATRARDAAVERGLELEAVTSAQESMLRDIDAAAMGDRLRESLLEKVNTTEEFARITNEVNFTSVAIQSLHESVLTQYQASINSRFADQPRLRARLFQQLAETMNSLGLHAEALPIFEDALSTRRVTLGDGHEETLETAHALGSLLSRLGQHDAALALCRKRTKGDRACLVRSTSLRCAPG